MRQLVIAMFVVMGLAARVRAEEPRAELSLKGRPHAGVPFNIAMVIVGFDETPVPAQPKLDIAGAKATPLAPEPQVSQGMQILNGKQSVYRRVRWILRWRVEIENSGRVHVPPVTVVQGSKRVTTAAGELEVEAVATTDDMKIELVLPDRPVFVGETIEARVIWHLARKSRGQMFSVPLMTMDEFVISAPPVTDPDHAFAFQAGSKELSLHFDEGQDGRFTTFTMPFSAVPKKPGRLQIAGPTVVAALTTQLFRTTGAAKTLEVKPLPETDKPPGFAGAVGTQFSIAVSTSRSVVQLGEPVELAITVKSNQRLDTLSLGRLDAPGGLPKDKFTVSAETPTGELADDGKSKKFLVTAQVTGPATEIPAIAFSYFDQVKGHYQTIHSDPIAVAVKGGSVVGAGDVVAMAPKQSAGPATAADTDIALVAGELALSSPSTVTDRPLSGVLLWLLVIALYAIPLALFGARSWQVRTQSQREEAAEVRAARRRVEQELARAAKEPARDTAGPLVAALRGFARTIAIPEREPSDSVLAEIENAGYGPSSATSPLPHELHARAADLMRRWTAEASRKRPGKGAAAAVALAILFAPHAGDASALDDGRAAYQQAMTLTDATARKAAFARAATALGDAVRELPDRPELLTDWGNAALGGGDVATATLAYRRALAIDGGTARARRNLSWLRSKLPDGMRPAESSATDTLFFFHHWPRPRRLLIGAAAFAIAILLLVPWAGRRRRAFAGASALPFAVWLAMVGSLVLEDRHADDAVVMDGVVLRAADSTGAPAALTQPLPRGVEVSIVERRDTWTKIRLANGSSGWVPDGAVQRISR